MALSNRINTLVLFHAFPEATPYFLPSFFSQPGPVGIEATFSSLICLTASFRVGGAALVDMASIGEVDMLAVGTTKTKIYSATIDIKWR